MVAPGSPGEERRLKVLHVVRQFPPSTGGLENYVQELATRQAKKYDVDVLTLDRVFGERKRLPKIERMDGFAVRRISFVGGRRAFLPFLNPFLLRKYDLIHIHCADQLLDSIALASLFMPLRIFMTTHGLFFHTEALPNVKNAYFRTVTKWGLKRARRVFAVSASDASKLEEIGLKATVLRNPIVPFGNFLCEGHDLLYLGRLSENKRVDALIPFMAALAENSPSWRLHIVGADRENLWPGLEAEVRRRHLQENIRYYGHLDPKGLKDLMRKCGFTVSASRYEGFGLTTIEGMTVGLLPVMHANAAFRETFERAGCGLLTDFDTPAQAAHDFAAWSPRVTREDRENAARFGWNQSWDALPVTRTYDEHYRQAD